MKQCNLSERNGEKVASILHGERRRNGYQWRKLMRNSRSFLLAWPWRWHGEISLAG
jgi:hypothetical protein